MLLFTETKSAHNLLWEVIHILVVNISSHCHLWSVWPRNEKKNNNKDITEISKEDF